MNQSDAIEKMLSEKEIAIKRGLIGLKGDIRTPNVSARELGVYGDHLAEIFFKQCGWTVKMAKDVHSTYDMLVSNGNETYAVNVKFGNKPSIKLSNILDLFNLGVIPAFLFISSDKKYLFLVPKTIG